jgi:hypothetical protein
MSHRVLTYRRPIEIASFDVCRQGKMRVTALNAAAAFAEPDR